MLTESIVVVILTLMIAYLYGRQGSHGTAVSILPITVLPICCIAGYALQYSLPGILPGSQWRILFVLAGLLAGGSLFGIISRRMKNAGSRRVYLIICGGFTILFAFAEVVTILNSIR